MAIPELEFDQMANLAAVAVFLEVASLRAIARPGSRANLDAEQAFCYSSPVISKLVNGALAE